MDVEELVHSVDIVAYIGQFVDLEEKNGEWWGLSPFKDEKTPSFSVRSDPPFYCDFSSGSSGNLIGFIKQYNRCSGREAVEILKEYAGITGEIEGVPERLAATKSFRRFLPDKPSKPPGKSTVLPSDIMERYEVRPDKLAVWENEGISKASMEKFCVRYDPFSNRIVYPIHDKDGNIVNIGGRTLDPDYKERKLRKYTYFYGWGTMNVIYGLWENLESVLKKREIILFEGAKSVLLADTWGISNTGAVLTSHLNPSQTKLLACLGCRVVFALDKEIKPSQDKNIRKLSHYVGTETLIDRENLLDEKDAPVDRGKEVFERLYAGRIRINVQ